MLITRAAEGGLTMNAKTILSLLLGLAVAASVQAEQKYFEIDPVHSSVSFNIRHLYSTFRGRFNSFSGTIEGDLADPVSLRVSASVDVGSVDTANSGRDDHLRTPDFFDVKIFPVATFESTGAAVKKGNRGTVTGNLTIRKVTKEIVFEGEFLGYGPDHKKGNRAGFHATAKIDRRDFGVNFNGELPDGRTMLGNEVELILDLEVIQVEKPEAKSLADSISEYRGKQSKPRSQDITDALARAADDIMKQGSIEGLKAGEKAPDFTLPDINGVNVSLSGALKNGPVVLVFYRGEWCPFCNLQLRALEVAYPDIRALGASLVAVAPQMEESAGVQAEDNNLSFPLLSDTTGKTMRDYRLLYQVPASLKKVFLETYGVDLEKYNGEDRWELPVTATFVIGIDGKVKAGLVDMDYTKRMEPSDILAALRSLKQQAGVSSNKTGGQ
jgi:polyisoprenoid-binding protein YceI/peroxiredoxin